MDRYMGSQIVIYSESSREVASLAAHSQNQGWLPTVLEELEALWSRLHRTPPDVVILHLKKGGGEWGRHAVQLRTLFGGPVLLLAGKGLSASLRRTLAFIADESLEYSGRPESAGSRIRFWLAARKQHQAEPQSEHFGAWTLYPARREIYFQEQCIPTTAVQFELLAFFLHHSGKVMSRDEIYTALFKREYDGLDRMIDIQISRLRRLLQDDPRHPKYLKTIHGRGYLFCATPVWPGA